MLQYRLPLPGSFLGITITFTRKLILESVPALTWLPEATFFFFLQKKSPACRLTIQYWRKGDVHTILFC